jgi:cytochrome oxidase Cu insertion factor (SCO1/SenC/PrrC family)
MARKQSQTKKRKAAVEKQKQQKQQRYQLLGIVALLLVVAVATFSFVSNQNVPKNVEGQKIAPEVGAEAPDFSLVSNDGETVALSDYRGQPVAVVFMHTW